MDYSGNTIANTPAALGLCAYTVHCSSVVASDNATGFAYQTDLFVICGLSFERDVSRVHTSMAYCVLTF